MENVLRSATTALTWRIPDGSTPLREWHEPERRKKAVQLTNIVLRHVCRNGDRHRLLSAIFNRPIRSVYDVTVAEAAALINADRACHDDLIDYLASKL